MNPLYNTPCAIDGCTDNMVSERGWCRLHLARWRKFGDPLAARKESQREKPCKQPGCGRMACAHDYCKAHTMRFIRGANMEAPIRGPRGKLLQSGEASK